MQITNVKAMVAKVLVAGFLAGAVVMAAPAKAHAQEVIIRAYRGPSYVAPGYVAPSYVAVDRGFLPVDRFAYDRDFRRHAEWERSRRRFAHDQYRRGSRGYDYR
jgi:hypothetical protein